VTKADKARHYTIARGSARESAAQLDVLKVGGTMDVQPSSRGIELLERVVAMLTQLIYP
jgi:four helix bundle protein